MPLHSRSRTPPVSPRAIRLPPFLAVSTVVGFSRSDLVFFTRPSTSMVGHWARDPVALASIARDCPVSDSPAPKSPETNSFPSDLRHAGDFGLLHFRFHLGGTEEGGSDVAKDRIIGVREQEVCLVLENARLVGPNSQTDDDGLATWHAKRPFDDGRPERGENLPIGVLGFFERCTR
jgi:hypothetical protein